MNEQMSFPEVWAPPYDDVSEPLAPEPVLPVLEHCDPLSEHTVFVSRPSLGDDEWAAYPLTLVCMFHHCIIFHSYDKALWPQQDDECSWRVCIVQSRRKRCLLRASVRAGGGLC